MRRSKCTKNHQAIKGHRHLWPHDGAWLSSRLCSSTSAKVNGSVSLPTRPNGTTGWLRTAEIELRDNPMFDHGRRARTSSRGRAGQPILDTSIAIGSQENPTPSGDFFVTDIVDTEPERRVRTLRLRAVRAFRHAERVRRRRWPKSASTGRTIRRASANRCHTVAYGSRRRHGAQADHAGPARHTSHHRVTSTICGTSSAVRRVHQRSALERNNSAVCSHFRIPPRRER